MKGGTAINLFVQDMPRLSVDIDVVYTPWRTPREQALKAISDELDAIADRLGRLGLATRKVNSRDLGDTKLLIENAEAQVKVEVNVVFRGTVLPVERHPLSRRQPACSAWRWNCQSWHLRSCMGANWSRPWTASIRATFSAC